MSINLFTIGCSVTPPHDAVRTVPGKGSPLAPLSDINRMLLSTTTQSSSAAARTYQIGPEDMLQITILNIPKPEGRRSVTPRTMDVRVSQQGAITLPLVGEISVQDMTIATVEQKLRGFYERYIHQPEIRVLVTEYRSQRVAVVGAVLKPGVFELSGPKTVIDLLALAGGLSTNAGGQVHLHRDDPAGRTSYVVDLHALTKGYGEDLSALTLPVKAGDVLTVPEAGTFFVDGAVRRPGSYPLTRRYTVAEALVTAGGVDRELANMSGVMLFRNRGDANPKSIPVDLDEILSGRAPDPEIHAEDVIVVPISTPKYLVRRFLGVIVTGVSLDRVMPY
ncbi:MAG: SLBB domain-containing protein [Candidatus Binatia bacterium]